MLGQHASLTELNLSSCKMRYLAMGFTAPVPFDSLAVLNLHDNALGIAGMVMLSGFLRACTALTDLSVSCNRFWILGMQYLCDHEELGLGLAA